MENKVLLVIPISNLEMLEEMKEIILDSRVLVRVITDEEWELIQKNMPS